MTHWVPELLAPAGSLEKLKVAVLYGADAVYLGGQKFGLRTAADNFTYAELEEGVEFAHERGAQVYVVLNSFLHDSDLEELPEFLSYIEKIKVDAVIVSDLGVVETVAQNCSIDIHLSTQASCLNSQAALLWKEMGVTRIVLGREVSVAEAAKIKEVSGLEVEMFIHGSMCMAYSGNCVISNFTQGRDSNRGGCAHSCRFEYSLDFSNIDSATHEQKNAYFMSSKDLEGIRVLPEFIKGKIDSLKVEGRMKSPHYAGTISKVYSSALKYYREHGHVLSEQMLEWERELRKITHREYTQASLIKPADATSIYSDREHEQGDYTIAGVVLEVVENDFLLVEVRSAFEEGDDLELVPFDRDSVAFKADFLIETDGERTNRSRPGILLKIPYVEGAKQWNLLRSRDSR
ncbi:U32 family peptidase [Halobacteriovorax sp. HLS]|uniref:peptidase U32 family protein n=1 Tax=Halobacteriovorax sp. HLS TaxID=2234000 RepID=UPI000FD7B3C8|nr:U32 family peptidase [Halobacteriovorax sp. HLS]